MVITFHVEHPAGPPVREPSGYSVVRGPGMAALTKSAVLDQSTGLLVAKDRQPVWSAGTPTCVTSRTYVITLDREGGV